MKCVSSGITISSESLSEELSLFHGVSWSVSLSVFKSLSVSLSVFKILSESLSVFKTLSESLSVFKPLSVKFWSVFWFELAVVSANIASMSSVGNFVS